MITLGAVVGAGFGLRWMTAGSLVSVSRDDLASLAVLAVGAVAWCAYTWLAVVTAATVLEQLPGALGNAAGLLASGLTSAGSRALLRSTLGVAAVTPLTIGLAHATPTSPTSWTASPAPTPTGLPTPQPHQLAHRPPPQPADHLTRQSPGELVVRPLNQPPAHVARQSPGLLPGGSMEPFADPSRRGTAYADHRVQPIPITDPAASQSTEQLADPSRRGTAYANRLVEPISTVDLAASRPTEQLTDTSGRGPAYGNPHVQPISTADPAASQSTEQLTDPSRRGAAYGDGGVEPVSFVSLDPSRPSAGESRAAYLGVERATTVGPGDGRGHGRSLPGVEGQMVRPDRPGVEGRVVVPDRPTVGAATRYTPIRAPRRVVVRPGDTLWSIARAELGPNCTDRAIAARWPDWYATNAAAIGPDPDRLEPGQVLQQPSPSAEVLRLPSSSQEN
ncbi:LysM peptidoglycan-binding domain-containing protein [Kribbella sp. NBC_01245]|uniref:LysM peptidoglycan-binding domain-containing protein n=1 Tax=Kribbella sp. NBC_01245 TaxID=2903578 RepID=UPI002E28DBCD|nr:LysM peptidoglycan-binding domain-containing protein [Kribbella sp. NBC_01245]